MHKMNFLEKLVEKVYFNIPDNLAIYDQLTKVYNSNWLLRVGYKKYNNKKAYVTMIDLNNFKKINDLAGHTMGNGLLIAVGQQLLSLKYIDNDIDVCRMGGDEFVIFSNIDISVLINGDNSNLISYGVYYKEPDVITEAAIKIADHNMYTYKKKNKTVIKNNQEVLDIIKKTLYEKSV